MNEKKRLEEKFPQLTGVYFFKNSAGEILYIGKAKNLNYRINSYFQRSTTDWKINQLLSEYATIEYILTTTEYESLLLEAQLIQQYKPKFNVLIKEGQPFIYILFTNTKLKKNAAPVLPSIELVRNKKRKGTYFGPFLHKTAARKTYEFLMHTFRLKVCNKKIANGCLDYHLGNCAGSCLPDFDLQEYTVRVELAKIVLKKDRAEFIDTIKKQIAHYSSTFEFEKAQRLHNYLQNIDTIFATIDTHFTEDKFDTDVFVVSTPTPYTPYQSTDVAINKELQLFLGTKTPIQSIDCFDISHFQSNNIVGSCIRFTNGKPDKHLFRRFKIKSLVEQNDYAALQEIVSRRYKAKDEYPDVILIDGGKGQLSAVHAIVPDAYVISLAKREEMLYGKNFPDGIKLDIQTDVGKLLIALRDYAHHFAISYHRLKRKLL